MNYQGADPQMIDEVVNPLRLGADVLVWRDARSTGTFHSRFRERRLRARSDFPRWIKLVIDGAFRVADLQVSGCLKVPDLETILGWIDVAQ